MVLQVLERKRIRSHNRVPQSREQNLRCCRSYVVYPDWSLPAKWRFDSISCRHDTATDSLRFCAQVAESTMGLWGTEQGNVLILVRWGEVRPIQLEKRLLAEMQLVYIMGRASFAPCYMSNNVFGCSLWHTWAPSIWEFNEKFLLGNGLLLFAWLVGTDIFRIVECTKRLIH